MEPKVEQNWKEVGMSWSFETEENSEKIHHQSNPRWGINFLDNEPFEKEIRAMVKKGGLLLDVGCGPNKIHKSFIGVDPYAENNLVNVKAYMWDMPFPDNSVDGITCFAALEHISKFQVLPTLSEFSRVLKSGAKAIILVPDLIYCLQAFIANPTVEWEMDLIFGLQSRDNMTIHEGEFHRTGFTKEIIHLYFENIPGMKVETIYAINAYTQLNHGIIAVKE